MALACSSSVESFIRLGKLGCHLGPRCRLTRQRNRLPVPDLWLDIFQKIKVVGFNAVSWYADWALLEGKQGEFSAEGIFDFEPFFNAATEAGIYLIAVCETLQMSYCNQKLTASFIRDLAVGGPSAALEGAHKMICADHGPAYINAESSGGGKRLSIGYRRD